MGAKPVKPTTVKNDDKPIIMVIGGPGTGKGTQCSWLAKDFGFAHISLGDILRDEVKHGSDIGHECAKIMKEGKLVPVNVTLTLMKKAMSQSSNSNGYLIDGFPRACAQAKAFQKQVRAPTMVLYLHAPLQVLMSRLMQRGQTSGRSDDNVESIKKRFVTFRKESMPVVSYYEKFSKNLVKKVSTVTAPDDVYTQVRSAVKSVLDNTSKLRRHVRRRVGVKARVEAHKQPPVHRVLQDHCHQQSRRSSTRVTVKKSNADEALPRHRKKALVCPIKPEQCTIM